MARMLTDVMEREAYEDALDPLPEDDLPASDIDASDIDASDIDDPDDAFDDPEEMGDGDPFEDEPAALLDDDFADADGGPLPDEVQAEIEALAAEGLAREEAEDTRGLEQALAATRRELERQRDLACAAVARYREAMLAAEPDLPPEMVRGESIEEVDASIVAARTMVARVRERVEARRPSERGFPAGAPARESSPRGHLTARQKIAAGLQERLI